jgi:hypothetical protein
MSFFVESPDYYEGGEFHEQMNSLDYNKEKTSDLIKDSEFLFKFKGYDVYKFQHPFFEEDVSYFLIKHGVTEGATHIASKKSNNFCLGVWQRNVPENTGLIRSFYAECLSSMYDSIISDKTANKLGMKFWEKLLNYFSEHGYQVTVLRGSLTNEEPYIHSNFLNYWTTVNKETGSDPTFVSNKNILFKIRFKQP